MKIYAKTRRSHSWNEDRFIVGNSYAVVIDGATPLKKANSFNEARWMVDYIKSRFDSCEGSVKSRLERLSADAFRDLPAKIKEEDYLPSASACWAELEGDKLKIGILGDCEVTCITKGGEVVRFFDGRLDILDKRAIDEMVAIAKRLNIHVSEARTRIQDTLIKHRKLANKEGGYNALTLSPTVKIDELKFEIGVDDLKTAYLYSDGFAQAFNSLGIYPSHKQMFENLESVDGEIQKIVDASEADRFYDKHPRFKKIDDITVVRIDF